MAIGFRRQFRMLERLFPSSGINVRSEFPSYVDETVVPTWDLFDVRPGDVQYHLRRIGGNSSGAGTNNFLGTEPPAGYVFLPQRVCVAHADPGLTLQMILYLGDVTTTASDPWGSWHDEFKGAGITFPIEEVSVPVTRIVKFSSPLPPVFRGERLQLQVLGMSGAGILVAFDILGVFVPGEAVRLEHWNK